MVAFESVDKSDGHKQVAEYESIFSKTMNKDSFPKAFDYGRVGSNCCAGVSVAEHELKFDVGTYLGARRNFEDRWSVDVRDDYQAAVFCIFDGHNGVQVVEALESLLGSTLIQHPLLMSNTRQAIAEVFESVDGLIKEQQSASFRRQAGSTAVVAVVLRERLFIAHVGDTRATVISPDAKVLGITTDHRASRRVERERVQSLGGKVSVSEDGMVRVEGVLQVSRAFGHSKLKQFIRAEPDVLEFALEQVKCVVLATDGLHDVVDNPSIMRTMENHNSSYPAKDLVELARRAKAKDNVCVLVLNIQQILRKHSPPATLGI